MVNSANSRLTFFAPFQGTFQFEGFWVKYDEKMIPDSKQTSTVFARTVVRSKPAVYCYYIHFFIFLFGYFLSNKLLIMYQLDCHEPNALSMTGVEGFGQGATKIVVRYKFSHHCPK